MKKTILTVLALCILIFTACVSAEDLISGDFSYTVLPDGSAEILRYQGEGTEAAIPAELDGHRVISVGALAFGHNTVITSVTVPEGVTAIGDNAFGECTALTSVSLPDGLLTLGDLVFQGCTSLKEAALPGSLVSIGENPFDRCDLISAVSLPEDHPFYTVTDGVLFDRRNTQLVSYPSGKTDSSYTVPEWVTSIGLAAFSENSHLQELTLPDGLSELGGNPFCGCTALKTIRLSENHLYYEIKESALFSKRNRELVAYLWAGNQPVYNIPEGTASIAQEAFYKHPELSLVMIPDSVHAIGVAAFAESGLEAVKLPDSITRLEDSLFSGCQKLRNVVLPKNLTSIGSSVFYECTYLRQLRLPSGLRSIGAGAFYLCQSLTAVTLPEGVESLGNYAFAGCFHLSKVTLPKSLRSIGSDIFYGVETVNLDVSKGSYAEEWADANGIPHEPDPVEIMQGETI